MEGAVGLAARLERRLDWRGIRQHFLLLWALIRRIRVPFSPLILALGVFILAFIVSLPRWQQSSPRSQAS